MLNNAALAELLTRDAETATGHLVQALRRAAREASCGPEEAAALAAAGRSLTALAGIGPALGRIINFLSARELKDWAAGVRAKAGALAK